MSGKKIFAIVMIIVLCGFLGGLGNYYTYNETGEDYNFFEVLGSGFFHKSLVLGLLAAGTMPLFLNIISSNLLDADEGPDKRKSLLIFGSLCILSAIFSGTFLEGTADRVIDKIDNVERKVERVKEEVKEVDARSKRTDENQKEQVASLVIREAATSGGVSVSDVLKAANRKHSVTEKEEFVIKSLSRQRVPYVAFRDKLLERTGSQYDVTITDLIAAGVVEEFEKDGKRVLILSPTVLAATN